VKSESPLIFEGLAIILRDKKPLLWAGAYPRIFLANQSYAPPTDASVDLTLVLDSITRENDFIEEHGLEADVLAANKVLEVGVPTFHIAPRLLTVVQNPHAAIEIDWTKMKLPSEAGVFIFPRRGFRGSLLDELTFVWYARVRAGESVCPPHADPIGFADDIFFIRSSKSQSVQAQTVSARTFAGATTPIIRLSKPTSDVDALTNVVFNMLLLMTAHPELVATGLPAGKRSQLGQEYWTPTIVGHNFEPSKAEKMIGSITSIPECDPADRVYAGEEFTLPDEDNDLMQGHREAFKKQFGREMRAGDPLFWDLNATTPQPVPQNEIDEMYYELRKTMLAAGIAPAWIYASKKTGFFAMEGGSWEKMSPAEQQEWTDAIAEYGELVAAGTPPELP
jgi:hypothetical protein